MRELKIYHHKNMNGEVLRRSDSSSVDDMYKLAQSESLKRLDTICEVRLHINGTLYSTLAAFKNGIEITKHEMEKLRNKWHDFLLDEPVLNESWEMRCCPTVDGIEYNNFRSLYQEGYGYPS